MISFKKILWASRKLKLPIGKNDLVLDVGSGSNPHPRSDVLLDRISGQEHRGGDSLLFDRIAVIGDATKLPFKDKSFDFVIASHILEHIPNPELFLNELQRVSKAGYIETPNFISERLIQRKAHCLELGLKGVVIQIHKKKSYLEDNFFDEMDILSNNKKWKRLYDNNPDLFHLRYFWKDKISFNILNPDISCEWINQLSNGEKSSVVKEQKSNRRVGWRYLSLLFLEFITKINRNRRLKKFDLFSVLACPTCKNNLTKIDDNFHCCICDINYRSKPYPNFENSINNQ
jgi:SAM-dependent methyltransferase